MLLIGWLVGCGLFFDGSEDSFKDQYASLLCQRTRECVLGAYQAEYDDDMDDCIDDVQDVLDEADGGDFDDDEASKCLEELRSISCGDMWEDGLEDCGEVWDYRGSSDSG